MQPEWHFCSDGKDYGPVSFAELRSLADAGRLLPTDILWNERLAEWMPAGELGELFPEPEEATVIISPDEANAEDPLGSLRLDVGTRPQKRGGQAPRVSPRFPRSARANNPKPFATNGKTSLKGRSKSKKWGTGWRLLIGGGLVACVTLVGVLFWNGSSVVQGVTGLSGALTGGGKAITLEQYQSVPRGALRFRVEDIFGSPLASTHDFEDVEQYGSNGEIFGSQFVNTFMLAYRLSDKPGKVAVFVFQGSSTNPPMVEKHVE